MKRVWQAAPIKVGDSLYIRIDAKAAKSLRITTHTPLVAEADTTSGRIEYVKESAVR